MLRDRRLEIILVAVIVVLAAFYARASYIPTWSNRHVEIGAEKLNLDLGEPSPWFSAWSIGDGQAYAVIAADPSGVKLGQEIKEPAYRFARAGYSWLAALLTLGVDELVPYGLALVGAASLAGTLVLAIALRDRLGWKTWLLTANPAIFLGFAGDTSEPLGALLLAATLASGSMSLAVALGVTRPTYLLALLGRWKPFGLGLAAAIALGVYSLWRFGLEGAAVGGGRIGIPLFGYLESPSLAGSLLGVLALITAIIGVARRDWTWFVVGLFVLSFGPNVTSNPINAWRAAGLMPVLWAFGPGHEVLDVLRSRSAARVGSVA
jgi:hypothetical protein